MGEERVYGEPAGDPVDGAVTGYPLGMEEQSLDANLGNGQLA